MVTLSLTPWGTAKLCSKAAAPFTFLPAMYKGSNFSPSLLYLLLFAFFIISILVSVKWYLMMILTCFSLMTNDIEHVFKCLLAICISSLEKFLFQFFLYFIADCLSFLLLSCKNASCILDASLLSDIWFKSIFSHSVGWVGEAPFWLGKEDKRGELGDRKEMLRGDAL